MCYELFIICYVLVKSVKINFEFLKFKKHKFNIYVFVF